LIRLSVSFLLALSVCLFVVNLSIISISFLTCSYLVIIDYCNFAFSIFFCCCCWIF
jgi:hypothetical protein